MAETTIVNTPASSNDSGASGLILGLIILVIVVVGGFVWYRYYGPAASPSTTNINVTVPVPGTGNGGATTP